MVYKGSLAADTDGSSKPEGFPKPSDLESPRVRGALGARTMFKRKNPTDAFRLSKNNPAAKASGILKGKGMK